MSLKVTLSELLAVAVLDLFPGVYLGEGRATETGFSYQFSFSGPLHPELLTLVTEKLRALLKEHPPLESIEMAVQGAVHYFEHHDQPYKVEAAELLEDPVISLIRIGDFYDFLKAPLYQGDLAQVSFQLFDLKQDGEWVEISGAVFESKEELKAFVKKRKQWLKDKPWEEGERLNLLLYRDSRLPILLPEGVKIYRKLESFWKKQVDAEGKCREIVASAFEDYQVAAQKLKTGVALWGRESDLCLLFPAAQTLVTECISSLQFIQRTFKMLELDAKWVLFSQEPDGVLQKALKKCGFPFTIGPSGSHDRPTIELRILDTLGEAWPGPFLSIGENNSLIYSLLGPVNRLIALMAEHNKLNLGEKEKFES